VTSHLAYRPPFAEGPLISFISERAIPGVEVVEGSTFRRSIRSEDGDAVVIALTPNPAELEVRLDVESDEAPQPNGLVQTARRLLDLDADATAIDATLKADPVLRPLVRRTSGIRLPGAADGFELAVRAVVGQQVSVRAARTLLGRITQMYGTPLDPPSGSVTHLFPDADQLVGASFQGCGLPGGRAETLRRLADLVWAGKVDLSAESDPQATIRALGEIRGVGAWTTAYIAMRALRDADAFPAGDLGVRRAFEAFGLPATPARILERAERWRPWRAYAVMHLWSSEP
jgi:AraC family transcriptional regulator, regulatory protein of adaptative response / DNA-3-methyladenine glycosylase II